MSDQYFTKQTFAFLSSLAENNTREWFEEHKQEYEDFVRTPALVLAFAKCRGLQADLLQTTWPAFAGHVHFDLKRFQ